MDPVFVDAKRHASALSDAGVSCMFDVMRGVAHANPPDFEDRISRALRFVLDAAERRPG